MQKCIIFQYYCGLIKAECLKNAQNDHLKQGNWPIFHENGDFLIDGSQIDWAKYLQFIQQQKFGHFL